MVNELAKELALVSCIIREEELINGTIFQTFDKIYEIAEAFVRKYPVDTMWGSGEYLELEYDETIIEFTKKYLNNEKI